MKRGEIIELEITSPAFEGSAVGRVDNQVVFVPFALPGDRIRARITRKKRKFAEAVIEKILSPSPDRTDPVCLHFGTCGGCRLQNAAYGRQLEYKQAIVRGLMERIGGLTGIEVRPVIPSPRQYGYRNKMEFSFGSRRWLTSDEIATGEKISRDFALGLHIPKRFDRILDLEECHLQEPVSIKILRFVRKTALDQGWDPYDVSDHTGYLRNLIIRLGINSGEVMVNLVTTSWDEERTAYLKEQLGEHFPEITTLLNSINSGPNPTAIEKEIVLFGSGTLHDRIGSYEYRIAPFSFFQPNTLQAENLFKVIKSAASPNKEDTVYDLYCGLGAIGIFLSKEAGRVIGVESQSLSIELARKNALEKGFDNCKFFALDVIESLQKEFLSEHGSPDIVILDPPRAGLHPKAVSSLRDASPAKIVYTSCNPATQARDLALLSDDYEISPIQPVDMFPQTWHIESVATLHRRKV